MLLRRTIFTPTFRLIRTTPRTSLAPLSPTHLAIHPRTMSSKPETTRPATKRVRTEDEDKEGNGTKEDQNQPLEVETDDKSEIPEWLKKPPFQVGRSQEGWNKKWRSSCWCGKTAFSFSHNPVASKVCHCEDCQRLHGAPFQHSCIFHKDMVRLDSGPEWLGFLSAHDEVQPLSKVPTPLPHKVSCRACGSPIFDEGRNMIMAFPPTFEFPRTHKEAKAEQEDHGHDANGGEKTKKDDYAEHGRGRGKQGLPEDLKAECHIFYERRLVDIKDGLPKWRGHKDQSEQMGDEDE